MKFINSLAQIDFPIESIKLCLSSLSLVKFFPGRGKWETESILGNIRPEAEQCFWTYSGDLWSTSPCRQIHASSLFLPPKLASCITTSNEKSINKFSSKLYSLEANWNPLNTLIEIACFYLSNLLWVWENLLSPTDHFPESLRPSIYPFPSLFDGHSKWKWMKKNSSRSSFRSPIQWPLWN